MAASGGFELGEALESGQGQAEPARDMQYQRPLCLHPGCTKQRKKGGYCKSHGGGIRCTVQGCSKSARDKNSGLCAEHGGGRVCSVPGCNKRARHKTSGLCAAHGSGKRMKEALSYGFRCTVEGCQKPAVDATYGVCSDHRTQQQQQQQQQQLQQSEEGAGETGMMMPLGLDVDHKAAMGNKDAYTSANHSRRLELMDHCEVNDLAEVQRLCQLDPQLAWHRRVTDGCTPLHVAVMAEAYEVAGFLIQQPSVVVDSKNDAGETPLHLSATMGNVRMAVFLLSHGANVNTPDSSRATPLHKAVQSGFQAMIQLLLENKAVPNVSNVHGETPLHLAVRKSRDREVVELLIKHGADVNAFNRAGLTPLDLVADDSTPLVQVLASSGAIPGAGKMSRSVLGEEDAKLGFTPISELLMPNCAGGGGGGEAAADKEEFTGGHPPLSLAMPQLLQGLGLGQSPSSGYGKGGEGAGAFIPGYAHLLAAAAAAGGAGVLASTNGEGGLMGGDVGGGGGGGGEVEEDESIIPAASSFLLYNSVLQASDGWKDPQQSGEPLHKAIVQGDLAAFTSLLENTDNQPALLDRPDGDGDTALHLAARAGQLHMVKAIIATGVHVDTRNERTGETALHVAAGSGHEAVVKHLLDNGADVQSLNLRNETALHRAASWSDGINHVASEGRLEERSQMKIQIVRDLLAVGAPVNVQGMAGLTPLHLAAQHESPDMVKCLLVDGEAAVNAQSASTYTTPLHIAANLSRHLVLCCLLEHGADPNLRDLEGETPLHVAARKGILVVVEVLLRANANPALRNKQGMTAYEMAVRSVVGVPKDDTEMAIQRLLKEAQERAELQEGQCGGRASAASSSKSSSKSLPSGSSYTTEVLGPDHILTPEEGQPPLFDGSPLTVTDQGDCKLLDMEKVWWRVFLSRRPEYHGHPFLHHDSPAVKASTLRQTALLVSQRVDVVPELVYFGVDDANEVGFHRTGVFCRLLCDLLDKLGEATVDGLKEYLIDLGVHDAESEALKFMEAGTGATLSPQRPPPPPPPCPIEYFKEVFVCLPPEGYPDPSHMPMFFKATKVRIGKLTRSSTWGQIQAALDSGLPALTQQDTNFTFSPETLLTRYQLVFFVRYAWEAEHRPPVPVLTVALDRDTGAWRCTTRRPFKVQDTLRDREGQAQTFFAMGAFLPPVEVYACYRPRDGGAGPVAAAALGDAAGLAGCSPFCGESPLPPAPARATASEQNVALGVQEAGSEDKHDGCKVLHGGGASSGSRSSISFTELYSLLPDWEDSCGADPDQLEPESGWSWCHAAAHKGDLNKLALLLFFGVNAMGAGGHKGETMMEVAAQYGSPEVLDFLTWVETRDLAMGGRVDNPSLATTLSRSAGSCSAPAFELPLASTLPSPSGHVYETITSPARRLDDCPGGGLVYDVQRADWASSSGHKKGLGLRLKLVEDLKELSCLQQASAVGSPFILAMVDGFVHRLVDEAGERWRRWGAIITPRCSMSLDERITGAGPADYDHQQAYKWCYQLAEALRALQAVGLVHCDVRPRNIQLQQCGAEEVIQLTNFGVAQRVGQWGVAPTECPNLASLNYVGTAPELREGLPFDFAADCFSLGVVLMLLLTRQPEASFKCQEQHFTAVSHDANRHGIVSVMLTASGISHSDAVSEAAAALLEPSWPDRMTASIASRVLRSILSAPSQHAHAQVKTEEAPDCGTSSSSSPPPLLPLTVTFYREPASMSLLQSLYQQEAEWWQVRKGGGQTRVPSTKMLFYSLGSLAESNRRLGNLLRCLELYQRAVGLDSNQQDPNDDAPPPAAMTEAMGVVSRLKARKEGHVRSEYSEDLSISGEERPAAPPPAEDGGLGVVFEGPLGEGVCGIQGVPPGMMAAAGGGVAMHSHQEQQQQREGESDGVFFLNPALASL